MRIAFLAAVLVLYHSATVTDSAVSGKDAREGYVEKVRQNYYSKPNNLLRQQITLELQASYFYQTYASFFDRADVALHGFHKFFSEMSKEEREHAEKLIEYVNKRGGNLQFADIKLIDVCNTINDKAKTLTNSGKAACICHFMSQKRDTKKRKFSQDTFDDDQDTVADPCSNRTDWKNGLMAMEDALIIERHVNDELLNLHKAASHTHSSDPNLCHFLEHHFLEEQVESIKKLADYGTQLGRFENSNYFLGEYMFDQKLK